MDSYNQFLDLHKPQLLSSAIPQHFWKVLYEKLSTDKFDAGNTFSLMMIEYSDNENNDGTLPVFSLQVVKQEGIDANDEQEIYLIDHAWTFKTNQFHNQLEEMPNLADRMSAITGVDLEDPDRISKLNKSIWKYCQSYSIQADGFSIEDRLPIWYVMDEVGSAVNHSDEPNFRIVPFIYLPFSITFSLLFPVKNCDYGDTVTRDFIENIPHNSKERQALLLPWKTHNFILENFKQVEPSKEYFTSGHISEQLPQTALVHPQINRDQPLKVYSEYDVLTANLTAPHFEIIDNKEDADILWLITHFKHFDDLNQNSPNKFINQFPYEYVITIKDLLSIICRRKAETHHDSKTLETSPKWLPTTYNLRNELIEFVSYYQNRQCRQLDNNWIIKPWNLARGLDIEITDNLWKIMRLQTTGPKLAQKYIENPVLFNRLDLDINVKFDIRYVILLKSIQPLEAYVHNKFYLRFANKSFSLNNFHEYEKHFTVMNYNESAELKHIRCEEFLVMWKDQYPQYNWEHIESDILQMLKEMLECAIAKDAPLGIGNCLQSRALYAADIMLSWDNDKIQPKLLEVNWMPDCKRACEYYPEFFNDCFKLLFLNEIDSEQFRSITN